MTGIPVSKCISRLKKAKNDTEKFAALLMVSKVVKSEECEDEDRAQVFDAVGFTFIRRLLKTKISDSSEGAPDKSYQHLAVNLLSSFCTVDKYMTSPEMFGTLPLLNDILTLFEKFPSDSADVHMMDDCYQCLTCIANRSQGRKAMISYRTIRSLCTVLNRELFGSEKALLLLRFVLHHCGSLSWIDNIDGLQELLNMLCSKYENEKEEGKFEVGKLLASIVSSANKEQLHCSEGNWKISVHKTLFSVLRNKLGGEQRNATIPLACNLVEGLGVHWVLKPSGSQSSSDDLNNRKSLLLLVHLICIEVRMSLEDKTFIQVNEKANMLCSCYSLLENVIEHMTSEESLSLEEKQTSQLYTAMLGAFTAVIQFLDEVRTHYEDQVLSLVTLASVRVLGAWIAEETTALQKDVVQLLPFLLQVGKDSFQMQKEVNEAGGDGVISMEVDVPSKKVTPATEVLKFLLPGICHLTSDETARKVVLGESGHKLLAQYFSYLIKRVPDETVEVEGSLLTTCGIFLNIAVLEPSLVAEDVAFHEILQYILHNIHLLNTDRQLVYVFNLVVLGLMILRHKITRQGVDAISECGQFMSTVIRLVSSSHVLRKDGGKCCMRLCDDYAREWDNIAELWFLAMQSLAACVPLLPWLPSMIVKTGWISSLLSMLLQAKGEKPDLEVLISYKVLLCELCANNESAKKDILGKGGVEVARMYSLKEVEDILR